MSSNNINIMLGLEWDMFQQVTNVNGRASCQDNPDTFIIMRQSQFTAWDPSVRAAYLNDLLKAKAEDRNLIFEKYTHMIKNTDPTLYEIASKKLPFISAEKVKQVRFLNERLLKGAEKCSETYPVLTGRGRPLRSEADDFGSTSLETYQEGELLTYSENTLNTLTQQLDRMEVNGQNLIEEILLNTVLNYGYENLSQAEKYQRESLENLHRLH